MYIQITDFHFMLPVMIPISVSYWCSSAQGPCNDQEKVKTAVVKAVNAI